MTRSIWLAILFVLASSLTAAACGSATASTSTTVKTVKATTTTEDPAESSTTETTESVDAPDTETYEQDAPGLEYSGTWTRTSTSGASKGAFVYAQKSGATLTFRFVGTWCAWVAKTAEVYGKALVSVDGKPGVTVDLYSKNTVWRHVVWKSGALEFGVHTVKIRCSGSKRTGAKGTAVGVDSIQIAGALVGLHQQDTKAFDYSKAWATTKNDKASGGSFAVTKAEDASVTVTFTGVQLDWYAKTGPPYGKARVTVDDEEAAVVDLYSAEEAWKQKVWSSGRLEMGEHTVTITRTGTKSADATDDYIGVDAFEVAGTLQ